METNLVRKEVEGLLFRYLHFYGTYDYVGDCRHWYRNEIRVTRNDKSIRSYKDAQGFRKKGEKLTVVPVDAVFCFCQLFTRNFRYTCTIEKRSSSEGIKSKIKRFRIYNMNSAKRHCLQLPENFSCCDIFVLSKEARLRKLYLFCSWLKISHYVRNDNYLNLLRLFFYYRNPAYKIVLRIEFKVTLSFQGAGEQLMLQLP